MFRSQKLILIAVGIAFATGSFHLHADDVDQKMFKRIVDHKKRENELWNKAGNSPGKQKKAQDETDKVHQLQDEWDFYRACKQGYKIPGCYDI
jgi:hypothetical protein